MAKLIPDRNLKTYILKSMESLMILNSNTSIGKHDLYHEIYEGSNRNENGSHFNVLQNRSKEIISTYVHDTLAKL
jgi:hypothetical protein